MKSDKKVLKGIMKNRFATEWPPKVGYIVIGAGFAGVCTALDLLKRVSPNTTVVMLEAGEGLFPPCSTSANQCGKLHLGLHYAADEETALRCLEGSVKLAKRFQDSLLGKKLELPWRRGRHYVMSGSKVKQADFEKLKVKLKDRYAKLVKKDKKPIFGPPGNFIRPLTHDEVRRDCREVDPDIFLPIDPQNPNGGVTREWVDFAYETAESQINLEALRKQALQELYEHKNFSLFPWHCVERIQWSGCWFQQRVDVSDVTPRDEKSRPGRQEEHGQVKKSMWGRVVANCAWQNAGLLKRMLGKTKEWQIRAKVSLLVELPDDHHHHPRLRDTHTCIFSIGEYCSFTNLGNGTAILTYEPVTRLGYIHNGSVLEYQEYVKNVNELKEFLRAAQDRTQDLTSGFGMKIADGIKNGVARFIPNVSDAVAKSLRLGYVMQEKERANSADPEAAYHRRMEAGIEIPELGVVNVRAIKMSYATEISMNATRAVLAVDQWVQKTAIEGWLVRSSAVAYAGNVFFALDQQGIFANIGCQLMVSLGNLVNGLVYIFLLHYISLQAIGCIGRAAWGQLMCCAAVIWLINILGLRECAQIFANRPPGNSTELTLYTLIYIEKIGVTDVLKSHFLSLYYYLMPSSLLESGVLSDPTELDSGIGIKVLLAAKMTFCTMYITHKLVAYSIPHLSFSLMALGLIFLSGVEGASSMTPEDFISHKLQASSLGVFSGPLDLDNLVCPAPRG